MAGKNRSAKGEAPRDEPKPFMQLFQEKITRGGPAGWFGLTLPDDVRERFPLQADQGRNSSRRPRPDANSKILMSVHGTLFTVIGGVAYGFTSDSVYRRIHYRCYTAWYPACCPNDCGGASLCARYQVCPRFYPLEDFADIDGDIMDNFCRLRVSPINGAVYLLRSGFRHGITSALAFDNYQFDWDDVAPYEGGVEEWNRLTEGVQLTEVSGGRYDP